MSFYEQLEAIGWENRGLTEGWCPWREFTITSFYGQPFRLRIDLSYAANGTWIYIHSLPDKYRNEESLRFSGLVFDVQEMNLLMKQLQITEDLLSVDIQ